MKISTVVPAAAVILGIALAGCSSEDPADSTGGMDMGSDTATSEGAESPVESSGVESSGVEFNDAEFNDADVMFTQMMYPHHAQAVEMANLVEGRTENQAIIDLAAEISAAQAPEMEQMATLLESFGQPAPSADMGMDMGGMEMGGMSGMMSAEDMGALEQASGAEFDQMWLTMMIAHHTGAIEMAEMELANGQNPDAQQIATDIIAAQEAEIEQMNTLLAQG